jgi:DNA-binding transcriptional MerR regulator
VSIRTFRYYEELGLLHPETTKGGIRLYAPSDIERVRKIIRLKELLNFTLDEVQEVVELDDQLDSLRERAEFERHVGHNWEHLLTLNEGYLALLGRQLEFVMAKRRRLDEMVAELEDKIARCRRRRQEFTAKARRQRR